MEMQAPDLSTPRLVLQSSGTKVYGPPKDWVGPIPSSSCELFIRTNTENICEHKLLQMCLQFGKIYHFRMPPKLRNSFHRYAFVRYTKEDDAECAMEVLKHHFVNRYNTLTVMNACEKCRIFIKNIPQHLTEGEIEKRLRTILPAIQRVYSCSKKTSEDSPGHVFVSFATHNEAMEARNAFMAIQATLGDDVEVFWAKSERERNCFFNKSLFFRNVDFKLGCEDLFDLIAQYVERTSIVKISREQNKAIVEFTCRQAADTILQQMRGVLFNNSPFQIYWAEPSTEESMLRISKIDFDAMLRIKCIANAWNIPVIIFGTYFATADVQYGAVFLRNTECKLRFIIVTLQCGELVDIHSRLCEVVVSLIDTTGGFPEHNYVFCAQRDSAYLAGVVVFSPQMGFTASYGMQNEFIIDIMEIFDLSWACALLSESSIGKLLLVYKKSCMGHNYMPDWIFGHRIFGAIMPKYRRKPPLKHNLDDRQVVLALCHQETGRNYSVKPHIPTDLSKFAIGYVPYFSLTLLPLSIIQSKESNYYTGGCSSVVLHSILENNRVMTRPLRRLGPS